VTSHADTCAPQRSTFNLATSMQVAAELGAKSVKGNDRLTPEEQEIDATSFVDESSQDEPDPPHEQQRPTKALSGGSLEGQVSDPGSIATQHDPAREHALQDGCVSVSHDNLDHIRYGYKHGRLHHDDNNGKTNGTAVSAELQTA